MLIITLPTTLEIKFKHDSDANVVSMQNNELRNVSDWLKVHKLQLNVGKSKYMIFNVHKRKVNGKSSRIKLKKTGVKMNCLYILRLIATCKF